MRPSTRRRGIERARHVHAEEAAYVGRAVRGEADVEPDLAGPHVLHDLRDGEGAEPRADRAAVSAPAIGRPLPLLRRTRDHRARHVDRAHAGLEGDHLALHTYAEHVPQGSTTACPMAFSGSAA